MILAAILAASTGMTAADYFFAPPARTNLIEGRVMSENIDYRLVRYEDLAWLKEAFAERRAMTLGDYFGATNETPLLVEGGPDVGAYGIHFVDPDVTGVDCAVTNYTGVSIEPTGLTNIAPQVMTPARYALVKTAWLSNDFAVVSMLRRFARPTGAGAGSRYESSYQQYGSTKGYEYGEDGAPQTEQYSYSSVSTNSGAFYECWKHDQLTKQWYDYVPQRRKREGASGWQWQSAGGAGDHVTTEGATIGGTKLEIPHLCNTNAWLRGQRQEPGWYSRVEAWGWFDVSCYSNGWAAVQITNAVVKLGEPTYSKVLEYGAGFQWDLEIESSAAVGQRVLALVGLSAGWVAGAQASTPPDPPSIAGQAVPVGYEGDDDDDLMLPAVDALHVNTTYSQEEREITVELADVILVFDLAPRTSLGGR